MPNSVAEAYLLILRPSFVPVVGEAVPIPFNEQIEIDEWSWTLENEEFVARTATRDKAKQALEDEDDDDDNKDKDKVKDSKGKIDKVKSIAHQISMIQRTGKSSAQKDKEIKNLMSRLTQQIETDSKEEAAQAKKKNKNKNKAKDADGKLKFTFKKNVDAATTQLLNSMKAGDLMPRAILTLFHRSVNAPVTLAIKFESVRLKQYTLSVDPSETMADLKEEWTATYESVEYSYQNRPAASGVNLVTKGTMRVFKKKGGSLI